MKCSLIHFKVLYLQALCLFFILCSSKALAQECPGGAPNIINEVAKYCTGFGCTYSGSDVSGATPDAACVLWTSVEPTAIYESSTSDTCNYTYTPTGMTRQININRNPGSCPGGYQPDGMGNCVSSCTSPNNCPEAGTAGTNPITTGNVTGQVTTASDLCIPQNSGADICGVVCDSGAAAFNAITGESNVECFSYTFSGNACTGTETVAAQFDGTTQLGVTPQNDPPQTADDCPPGTGFATINNTNSCLPGGSTITGANSTTTNSDGSSTTTQSTTQINSDGTSTTTTETGFTDANGNTTTATTTGSGGLDTSGDDSERPDFGAPPIFDQTLPIEADIDITVIDDDTPISTDLYGFTGSCPPPIVFTAMNQEFTISFQSVCDFAPIIRGIILMLASIASIRILVS